MNDQEAYLEYPKLRHWYNKLWLSEKLGYECGPAGIAPDRSSFYVVRPIMNLFGMGLNAKIQFIEKGDANAIEPGYFWCRKFEGNQFTLDISYDKNKPGRWNFSRIYKAYRYSKNPLYRFDSWQASNHYLYIPPFFDELREIPTINIECIDNRILEVHLRPNNDPDYSELIPVWTNSNICIELMKSFGYSFIDSFDDSNGSLPESRIGFLVKT